MRTTGEPGTSTSPRRRSIPKSTRNFFIWVAIVIAMVIAAWIASLLLTPPPPTMSQVTARVDTLADELVATIPTGVILGSTDRSSVVECPRNDGRRQYVLDRVIQVEPGFDRAAWMASRQADYGNREGWDSRVRVVGSQAERELKLVNQKLTILTVTGTPAQGGRLTLRAKSECAE